MHQALYRKWRPRNFDEVCGQDHVTSILKYECQTGHFSHAYLFCGSRGTGKTSCAKILAKAVNCLHPTPAGPCGECPACRSIDEGSTADVLEMDAASNNGVDDIRDIREEVVYTPSDLKYRVYIIDEVHMLSQSAFNALLKTLEEPPEHVIFILATTELQKLPATIVSRCQRFDFRRIATGDLVARLVYIAGQEDIALDPEAARLIARQAQGGMRDAISLLELCASSRLPVTPTLVTDTLGNTGREGMSRVVTAIADRDFDTLFGTVEEVVASSRDLSVFWQELISFYRDMLVIRTTKDAGQYLDLTDSEQDALRAVASRFDRETLLFHIGLLEDALFAMQKAYAVKRTVAEVTLVRLCDPALDTSAPAILARLSRLEEQVAAGVPVGIPAAGSPATAHPAPLTQENTPVTESAPLPETAVVDGDRPCPGDGATPAKVAISEGATEQPRKAVPPDAPSGNHGGTEASPRRVLRPLRVWTEAVSRVMESVPWSAAHLKQAKAFTAESGQVIIKFSDEFSRQMAMDAQTAEALRKALSVCLGRALSANDILAEVETAADPTSPLDLILEAAEEQA